MHGPGTSGPRFGDGLTLDGRIKVRLIDDVVKTINPLRVRKRRKWRRARNEGLALWEQAGLKFVVEVGSGERHSYYDPENPYDTYMTPLAVPKTIRLVRDATPPGGRSDVATYVSAVDGSVAAFDLEKPDDDIHYRWPRIVCHEVGHCLGLGHETKSDSVMLGASVPNAHDLESVSRYYLGYNWA